MKRKAALLLGALAALTAFVLRRRRPAAEAATVPDLAPDPRAEELRRRLAEARVSETAEPPAAEVPPPADEFEAMRRRVHAEGRAARDAMKQAAEDADKSSD